MNRLMKRYLTAMVSIALAFNPEYAAPVLAAGIELDARIESAQSTIKQAANGTAVVDIATPSDKGVSHNRFSEFNVDEAGAILNNSAAPVLTQLGGWADGNRRLAGGEARIILSEVTGSHGSALLGQLEVAGKSAEFILANANGITCNGCGFINTPRVSLITGHPVFAADQRLGFDVTGGDLVIDGRGLNVSNLDRFDIIARSAQINAAIYAKALNIYTGSNHYDYESNSLAAINPVSATPTLALDTSALGGMYANSIRLIGTEKGVGVNTQGLIQSVADLELTADGDIRLRNALAGNSIALASTSGSVTLDERVYGQQVSVAAGTAIANQGLLAAENSLSLNGVQLHQHGYLYAGLSAEGKPTNTGKLSAIFSESIINKGTLFVASDLKLFTPLLTNHALFAVQSAQTLDGLAELHNRGTLQFNTQADISLSFNRLDNNGGEISSSGQGKLSLSVKGDFDNSHGNLSAAQGMQLAADNINNSQGLIGGQELSVTTGKLINDRGLLQSNHLTLDVYALNNHQGTIYSLGKDSVAFSIASEFDNSEGIVSANAAAATITAAQLNNTQGSFNFNAAAMSLSLDQDFLNHLGVFQAGNTQFNASEFNNDQGEFYADQLGLSATTLSNHAGFLQAGSATISAHNYRSKGGVLLVKDAAGRGLTLTLAQQLDNSEQAIIRSLGGDLQIKATAISNSNSLINAAGSLSLAATSVNNQGGTIATNLESKGLQLNIAGALNNREGTLLSQGGQFQLAADQLNNTQGTIVAQAGALTLTSHSINNGEGLVQAATDATITSAVIGNTQGTLLAGNRLALRSETLDNRKGLVLARGSSDNALSLTGNIINQEGTFETFANNLTFEHLLLNNQQGLVNHLGEGSFNLLSSASFNNSAGIVQSKGALRIEASGADAQINNQGGLLRAKNLEISAAALIDNSNKGTLEGDSLVLSAQHINNAGGYLVASGRQAASMVFNTATSVDNRAGELRSSARDWALNLDQFDNSGGTVMHTGSGSLTLSSDKTLINSGTISSKADLLLKVSGVQNAGYLMADKNLTLTSLADMLNTGDGLIKADGDLQINADTFSLQNQGEINSGTGLAIALGKGNFSNSGTLITTADSATLLQSSFSNSGVFAHKGAGTININADLFSNTHQLHSASGTLVLNVAEFANSGTLSVHQLQIDNLISGSNSQRLEADHISLKGKTFSNSGTIAAVATADALTLNLQDFTNQLNATLSSNSSHQLFRGKLINAGRIEHSGNGQLQLGASGSVSNSGTIATAGTAQLVNAIAGAGDLFAKLGVVIGGADFSNEGNSIYTHGDMTITAALNNRGELLADGQLLLATNGNLNNNQGSLQGRDLRVTAAAVSNQAGVIRSTGTGKGGITAQQTIDNEGGTIASSNSEFHLIAGQAIANRQGVIVQKNSEGQGAGLLRLKAGTHIDNSEGSLIGEGQLLVDAGAALINRQAQQLAAASLTLNAAGAIDNSAGQISLSGSDNSSIAGQSLDNSSGTITANSDKLTFTLANNFSNSNGQLNHAGAKDLVVNANSMTTDGNSKLLSNGNIALTLNTRLDNQGEIGAQFNNILTLNNMNHSGGLDNSGTIRSNAGLVDLRLDHFSLLNRGALSSQDSVKITAKTIDNQDAGSVGADKAVAIQADGFTHVGNIVSNNNLTLTLIESLVLQANESLLAPQSLTITTQGGFDNAGTVSAVNDLILNGKYLNNNTTGKIAAGSGTGSSFTIAGDIVNQGLISAQQNLAITAYNLSNAKNAALVTGGKLSIEFSQPDPLKPADFINNNIVYAASDLSINKATAIANNSGAILLSGGAINLQASDSIQNIEGRIESAGDMTLKANTAILNQSTLPTLVTTRTGNKTISEKGRTQRGDRPSWIFVITDTATETDTISNLADIHEAKILAGGNLNLLGAANAKISNDFGRVFAARDLSIEGHDLVNKTAAEKKVTRVSTTNELYDIQYCNQGHELPADCGGSAVPSHEFNPSPAVTDYGATLGSIRAGRNITGNLAGKISNSGNDIGLMGGSYNAEHPLVAAATLVDGSRAQTAVLAETALAKLNGEAITAEASARQQTGNIPGNSIANKGGAEDAATSAKPFSAPVVAPQGTDIAATIAEQSQYLSGLLAKADPLPGANLNAPVVSFSVLPVNFNLNNIGGLYLVAQSPSSHYLIETRPEFTRFERFIGSDYLLAALGYDVDKTLKRLGDAFFETQLVKDALMAEAATRYLDGETKDFEQMQRLMDNAVNANKNMQLTLGVELTPEQAAALTQDMIWMVQKRVNGEKVLVPQLYLTSLSQEKLLASKAVIGAGGNINLAATGDFLNQNSIAGGGNLKLSTKGNFDQTGIVVARGDISFIAEQVFANKGVVKGRDIDLLAQGTLSNSGKLSAQDKLSLQSKGDISNQQGLLEGSDVALKSTDGSIINRTEFDVHDCTPAARAGCAGATTHTSTRVGPTSTIISRNSLILDANKNLDLQGSQFTAAKDISFTAGKDILLTAIEKKNASDTSTRKHSVKSSRTQFDGVDISAGGNLLLIAGRDLLAQGSQLSAGADAALTAGRDLNLVAMANTQHKEDIASRKKVIDSETTHSLVTVNTGGSTLMHAGQDANLTGVAVTAGGNIALSADRDTNISAVIDSDYHYDSVSKKKSFGRKKTTTHETLEETLVGGTLASGGDLLINAHKNADEKIIGDKSGTVNLTGVSLAAKNDIAIAADEDVNITGMQYQTLDYHQTKKSGALGFSKKDKGAVESDTHLQNASLDAGGNAYMLSGRDLTLAATNLVVKGDIDFQVVDNLLVTAGEAISNSEAWSKKSGVMSGGDLYRKTEHNAGKSVAAAQASNLIAGGAVTAYAGTGKIIGSNIRGDQGVILASDAGDFDLLAATTTTQAYHHDKTMKVGIGDFGKTISRPDQLIKNQEGRASLKISGAQFTSEEGKSNAKDMLGSTVASKQDVTVVATAGKVNLQAATLAADSDNNQEGTLGLAAALGVNIAEASNSFQSETKKAHGSAELSVVVQHQAVEVVKAAMAVDKAKEQLASAKKDFKAYERNLDQLETQLIQLESDYASKVPGVAYADLLQLREIIKDSKDDKESYQAGIALAAVNLTSSITALTQQTFAASQSTITYGFNAGVQLDIDASKSKSTDASTTAQASYLSGNNILIQTGTVNADGTLNQKGTDTNIQGSHLTAGNAISIQTGELNLLNSTNTSKHKSENEHGHITAQMTVYGASGGASLSGSFDRSKNSDATTRINNTTLNADKINLNTSGDANIRGANVYANSELITDIGGDLNLESQQNRSRSKNNNMGLSGGFSLGGQADKGTPDTAKTSRVGGNAFTNNLQGPRNVSSTSGVNCGINASNGMSLTRETILTSLTSGGTADIKVKGNTQITSALIATMDAEGNDTHKLNFDTGSLSFTDLHNTNISHQTYNGISTNIGIGDGKDDITGLSVTKGGVDKNLKTNTSNLTYENSQSNSASKTLATLGHGNITVGGTQLEQNGELTEAGKTAPSLIALNRDTSNTQKELWNSQQSQTVDATLDHRLLTKDGQKQIKRDIVDTGEFGQDIARAANTVNKEQDLGVTDFFNALGNNTKLTQLKNDLLRNPDNAHIVENLKNQDGDLAVKSVKEIGALAQGKFGFTAEERANINFYDSRVTTSSSLQDSLFKDTKGGIVLDKNNAEYVGIFIDGGDGASKTDLLSTTGHEVLEYVTLRTHQVNDNAQEALANAFGAQLSSRVNQAAGGDLDSTGGSAFNASLKNSAAVASGTRHANVVGNADMDNRRLQLSEAQILDKTRATINDSKNITSQEKSIAQMQLNALACSAVKCADGVPKDDPLYGQLKALQNTGETLNQQGTSLNTVLGAEAKGLFEYSFDDNLDDVLTEHGEGISRTSGAGLAVTGALGMLGGASITTGSAIACAPTAGLSCAAVPAGIGLTVLSEQSGEEGLHKVFDPYTSPEGKGVLDSFSEATHEGDVNPSKALGISLSIMAAEAVTVKFGSKLLDKALDGKVAVQDIIVKEEFDASKAAADLSPRVRGEGDLGKLPPNQKFAEIQTTSGVTIKSFDAPLDLPTNAYHAKTVEGPTQSVLDGINPKYFNEHSRFGGGFYIAENGDTAIAEVNYHVAKDGGSVNASYVIGYDLNLTNKKILDLSDPQVAKKWNYESNPDSDYSAEQIIGKKAKEQEFDAIRFPSLRAEGNNLVIFKSGLDALTVRGVSPAK